MMDVPGEALGSAAAAVRSAAPQGKAAAPSREARTTRAGIGPAGRAGFLRVEAGTLPGCQVGTPGRGFIFCGRMLAAGGAPCEGLTDIQWDPRMNSRRRVR